ncbi:hypothetical protein HDU97_008501 [Phlyctochytrium planicorne]|nr:hypothetical protein HDU97_008501 [Phlyctochytrium planicorne]
MDDQAWKSKPTTIRPATVVAIDIPLARTTDLYVRTDLLRKVETEMKASAAKNGLTARKLLKEECMGIYIFTVDKRTTGMAVDQAKMAVRFAQEFADASRLLVMEDRDRLVKVHIGVSSGSIKVVSDSAGEKLLETEAVADAMEQSLQALPMSFSVSPVTRSALDLKYTF